MVSSVSTALIGHQLLHRVLTRFYPFYLYVHDYLMLLRLWKQSKPSRQAYRRYRCIAHDHQSIHPSTARVCCRPVRLERTTIKVPTARLASFLKYGRSWEENHLPFLHQVGPKLFYVVYLFWSCRILFWSGYIILSWLSGLRNRHILLVQHIPTFGDLESWIFCMLESSPCCINRFMAQCMARETRQRTARTTGDFICSVQCYVYYLS